MNRMEQVGRLDAYHIYLIPTHFSSGFDAVLLNIQISIFID